ncbi:Fe2+-enterobactin ABC transporter substrate-binding protein [Corynebacterium sp. 13CS0277]|uniref:Fe2+-enterobactin ABC transporter substrate-binding protein n=1 Tax=Corynebacterium sp. 13CS0277 TaxID=2071994 RepID=UPI000D02AB2D|nr:Fe2+-enterobactin ABC transporter substrate-binding protein [Corynebacterium sp. 13CS0277]PRQ11227.1 Fe2+-enterobactin ABC transporter substrate-binding protein [Corynebacterium sp. 13CS0277]
MTSRRFRLRTTAAILGASALALTGCSNSETDSTGAATSTAATSAAAATQAAEASWPRTISTPKGDVEIKEQPKRIVSTAVTLTGSLLTIDAPVIATGGAKADTPLADSDGFFKQWAEVAHERDVKPLYQLTPNAEAILAEQPDLVIMAASGQDSAVDLYDQISAVVPTIVIDYSDKDWQEIATELGEATGLEANAEQAIADYNKEIDAIKADIALPEQPTSALVYNLKKAEYNIFTKDSAQGRLLTSLGFTVAEPDASLGNNAKEGKKRSDIVTVSGENLSQALNGESVVIIAGDEKNVTALKENPTLAEAPYVTGDRVYDAGLDSFRLDSYSSIDMARRLQEQLAK